MLSGTNPRISNDAPASPPLSQSFQRAPSARQTRLNWYPDTQARTKIAVAIGGVRTICST